MVHVAGCMLQVMPWHDPTGINRYRGRATPWRGPKPYNETETSKLDVSASFVNYIMY
jgi:hypothetical protein